MMATTRCFYRDAHNRLISVPNRPKEVALAKFLVRISAYQYHEGVDGGLTTSRILYSYDVGPRVCKLLRSRSMYVNGLLSLQK